MGPWVENRSRRQLVAFRAGSGRCALGTGGGTVQAADVGEIGANRTGSETAGVVEVNAGGEGAVGEAGEADRGSSWQAGEAGNIAPRRPLERGVLADQVARVVGLQRHGLDSSRWNGQSLDEQVCLHGVEQRCVGRHYNESSPLDGAAH
jgi:hypothetical protein